MTVPPRTRAWDPSLDPSLDWLERANRHALVTRLLTATVHDVSNALQVMSGAAEMLGLDASADAVAKRSASIVHQAMGATALLQQLTGFTREAARPPEPVRLRAVCEATLVTRQHALRKGRVAAAAIGDDVTVRTPLRPLIQVLLNLVMNAEQALADREAPALTLTVSREADGAAIAVHDNGPGMADGVAEQQFRWPPPSETAGLGIGLLVSRALVERAGGTLDLTTAGDGRGTTVTVRLRG